jgi:hypothetical protein
VARRLAGAVVGASKQRPKVRSPRHRRTLALPVASGQVALPIVSRPCFACLDFPSNSMRTQIGSSLHSTGVLA